MGMGIFDQQIADIAARVKVQKVEIPPELSEKMEQLVAAGQQAALTAFLMGFDAGAKRLLESIPQEQTPQ